ncbi:unnamed protein product, partial [Pylaiella littoralis]
LVVREDCTRYTRVLFLRQKSDAAGSFKSYLAEHRPDGAPLAVKIVHTDKGGDFDGEFEEVCRELCIKQENPLPQLGIAVFCHRMH